MTTLSLLEGRTDIPLSDQTLGDLITSNSSHIGANYAIKSGGHKYTFKEIDHRSARVARALIDLGVQSSEHVGIIAGNRVEYIDLFLGIGRIGRVMVALNPVDSTEALCRAVVKRSCKVIFVASRCGSRNLEPHTEALTTQVLNQPDSSLKRIIAIDSSDNSDFNFAHGKGIERYETFLERSKENALDDGLVQEERKVKPADTLTLQFTSGTTGEPKAAILTHHSLINNALHEGTRLGLTSVDSLCCPAALFRTFGLIMGFLTAFSHGTAVVFPGEEFNAEATVDSIVNESCTALLGESRLFAALIETVRRQNRKIQTLRTCLAAGAVVPIPMRKSLREDLGIADFVIAHGQTEIGPMMFLVGPDDPKDTLSVGKIMPHRRAKVIDETGAIVPRGATGELCVSGYGILRGYYADPTKTEAALRKDSDGVVWFHTGDEASIDQEGFCYYNGRLGDIITLHGGVKIYPTEIEQVITQHEEIADASVVPVKNGRGTHKDDDIAVAFLEASGADRPDNRVISGWIEQAVGSEKVPQHFFWIGDERVGDEIPKTYNGKHQKRTLSELAAKLIGDK